MDSSDFRTWWQLIAAMVIGLAAPVSTAGTSFAAGALRPGDDGNCWSSPRPMIKPEQLRSADLNIIEACTRLIAWQLEQKGSHLDIVRSYSARRQAYGRQGRADEALADAQSIAKYSTAEEVHLGLGEAYLGKKDYVKALEAFDRYKGSVRHSTHLLGRARALEGLGRKKEAIEAYKTFEKAFGSDLASNAALVRLGDRPAPALPKQEIPVAPPSGSSGRGSPWL